MTFYTRYSPAVSSVWEVSALWKGKFLNVLSLYYRKGLIDYGDGLEALDFAASEGF